MMTVFKITNTDANAAMSLKTWWALLFIYPLAGRLTVFLVNHTRISPNLVTFIAMGLRLVTAISFATATRSGFLLGALTYYIAYVCDCTDGAVARIKQQSSELGRYLDHIADLVGDFVILAVLASTQGMLFTPMVLGMLFMHVAECYMSYLAGFALQTQQETASSNALLKLINRYRDWWFARNIKSFISFPDYNALVFVFMPVFGFPALGIKIGFYVLLIICAYTVFSTFASIHSGRRYFP
jgi:phosphatidylglycerophosphate synthase